MSMTEKLLNKIRQKLLLMIMTRKIFHMTTMLIMKKMRMKHFHMTKKINNNNNNNKQTNKSQNYMFCSTSVKKNCTKRYKHYYKRKLKKEMPVRVLENRLCLFSRSLQNFLEKECNMRISRCVMPVGQIKLSLIDLSLLAVMQKSYAHVRKQTTYQIYLFKINNGKRKSRQKKEVKEHLISNELDAKTTEALKEQDTF